MRKRKWNGSLTVEASMALPMFLVFLINILFLAEIYRIHYCIRFALWEEGRECAKQEYISQLRTTDTEKNIEQVGIAATMILPTNAKVKTGEKIREVSISEKAVKGEIFFLPKTTYDHEIATKAIWYVKPVFLSGTFLQREMETSYLIHPWIGYIRDDQIAGEMNEEYVYITELGTAYHEKRSCPYLNPSVHSISVDQISGMRNNDGKRYSECRACASGQNSIGTCYITDFGDAFHFDRRCIGLKRNVFMISKSKTGGRNKCVKCCN